VPGIGYLAKKGKAKGCRHPVGTQSIADFWDCPRGPHPDAATAAPKIGMMGMFELSGVNGFLLGALRRAIAATTAEDPAWFSCTSGCCTAISEY
jgi:hypothetical protein